MVPGFLQNFVEWAYGSLTTFGRGMGGKRSLPYIPLFAAFFVLIAGCEPLAAARLCVDHFLLVGLWLASAV